MADEKQSFSVWVPRRLVRDEGVRHVVRRPFPDSRLEAVTPGGEVRAAWPVPDGSAVEWKAADETRDAFEVVVTPA